MSNGKFIVFEGIDGSGTTTQCKLAADWLGTRSVRVTETFEPTDGIIGKVIRQALSCKMPGCEGEELAPELFALLFASDRMHHIGGKVVPALERGEWVLSDRCYLSSFAYQSVDCDLDWVCTLNKHVRRADLTLLLDLDAEAAFTRFATTRANHEVFETVEKMTAIRENYLKIADILRAEGDRIVMIDASPPAEEVAAQIQTAISELL